MRVQIVQWHLRLALFARRVRAVLGASAISLFSFVIGTAIFTVPQLRAVVDSFESHEAILSQLGATYGTILALVLTLSIIPIQRAAEVWSPSIVRLYRRDPVINLTFVGLGVFCVASFLLAVRGAFSIPASVVLAMSLVVLGITLDILRWFHSHVCRLLDPVHAVSLALSEAKQAISRTQSSVARISRLQHQMLNPERQDEVSVEDIESINYPRMSGHPDSINTWVSDLAEIGIKAVTRGEKLLGKAAVVAIADLTIFYLSTRKLNLTLRAAPEAMFLAVTSDVSVVTDRSYEALQEVSRVAVTHGDEATAIRVTEAFQAIAKHTAHLRAPAFQEGAAPLTFGPIYYALECVKYAQSKGLDEVVFQSAGILSRIAETAPQDIVETDIHVPVIDGLREIAFYFYGKNRYGLAEAVNGHHFRILAQLLHRQDYFFNSVSQHVFRAMETLAPIAILSESMTGRVQVVHPLGEAYGLVNPSSLGYLFQEAAENLPKLDAQREWINPYKDLIAIAEIIQGHLRKIAEGNEFGESFLLWNIDETIKHISMIIKKVVDHPLRRERGDEKEIIAQLRWILAFYWVAFSDKKTIGEQRAADCCDTLGFIGLAFFESGYPDVLEACILHIQSILESYCDIARPVAPYTVGDLFAHLWGLRMALVARNAGSLTQKVDRVLATKPRGLSDEQWNAAQEAIMRRRQQLEDRLAQEDERMGRRDNAEFMIRRML